MRIHEILVIIVVALLLVEGAPGGNKKDDKRKSTFSPSRVDGRVAPSSRKPKTREVIGSNLKELGKAGIEKTGEVSLKLVAPVPTDASVLGQVLEIVKANPWIFIGALVIDIVTCICICCCCCIILCRGKA